jgi:hypothetical protein
MGKDKHACQCTCLKVGEKPPFFLFASQMINPYSLHGLWKTKVILMFLKTGVT